MEEVNYFDMAENDFLFLEHDYKEGRVGNVICYVAQNICERYLKHLIDYYIKDVDTTTILRTHSISFLRIFITEHLQNFKCDWSVVMLVNGYYYSARYPGKDSYIVTKTDVDLAWEAAVEVRRAVRDYLQTNPIKEESTADILKDHDVLSTLKSFDE